MREPIIVGKRTEENWERLAELTIKLNLKYGPEVKESKPVKSA